LCSLSLSHSLSLSLSLTHTLSHSLSHSSVSYFLFLVHLFLFFLF
jgi:hypothetical protein